MGRGFDARRLHQPLAGEPVRRIIPRVRPCRVRRAVNPEAATALALLLWLALETAAPGMPLAAPAAGVEKVPPERLVFLLEYVGADYENAVQDGRIVDRFEHDELTDFSRIVAEQYALAGKSEKTSAGLARLRALIRDLQPFKEVRVLSLSLADRVSEELGGGDRIAIPPDLSRGHGLYLENCAVCHGSTGGGDGPAAPDLRPPPTSFRDVRMNLVRPRQIHAATMFGVDRTAMPSFEGGLTPQQIWDISFYVMTLRQDFDPHPSSSNGELSLQNLASSSNEEILAMLRRARAEATARDVDYARLYPPGGVPTPSHAGGEPGVEDAGSEPGSDIQAAILLENAFARVAERVFPSVVGLSFYVRDASRPAVHPPGWREAPDAAPSYPGYRLLRRGSGFFISDDGTILSCNHLLVDPKTGGPAEIIDVEMDRNRHARARVIGLEPTVNLAVLKAETPLRTPPAVLGDSEHVRVGQWAIALADPPGVERGFLPGTISARPERDCYQEQRTATLLQTSLRISPESFGGPLVDIRGGVIGITVPAVSAPGTEAAASSAALALPIHLVMTLLGPLQEKESRRSPWLGISVLDLAAVRHMKLKSPPLTGLFIDDVFEPSPASKAGIRVGDILTEMDGNRLFAVPDFQRWLYLLGIGKEVSLVIYRDGKVLRPRVTIEERPAGAAPR
jgi:serine protease Do